MISMTSCDTSETDISLGPEWQRVEIPDAAAVSLVWAHEKGVVVETAANGAVGMMLVDWLGSTETIPPPPNNAPIIGLVPGHRRVAAVTAADDGTLVFHEFLEDSDVLLDSELSPPARQLEPLAVWWGTEDEGAILMAAYRRPDGTVGMHSMDWETATFETTARLFVAENRLDEVHVAAMEGLSVLVGPVGPAPEQLPVGDQAWAIPTITEFDADGQRIGRSWRTVALDPSPDAVTDVDGWEGDVFIAGRLGDDPLVWTVGVGPIDLPELEVSADGAVLIADPFWQGDDPAIGVETNEGPMLLLPEGDGRATDGPSRRCHGVSRPAIPQRGTGECACDRRRTDIRHSRRGRLDTQLLSRTPVRDSSHLPSAIWRDSARMYGMPCQHPGRLVALAP